MPVILIAAAVLLMGIVMMAVMLPLSIAMRFRAGTKRRRAWGWIVSANLFAAALSGALLLVTAAIANRWIPDAFRYTLIGCACGFALGFLGLATSHWEKTQQGLHYTPNRWLILMLTVVVTTRIIYGFWRAWHAWQTTPVTESWLATSGAAGSMGAGAAVLGYYLIYWSGLRRLVNRDRAARR